MTPVVIGGWAEMSTSGPTFGGVGLGVRSLWLAGSAFVVHEAEIAVTSSATGLWHPEQSTSTQTSVSSSRVGKVGLNVCKALSSQWVYNK